MQENYPLNKPNSFPGQSTTSVVPTRRFGRTELQIPVFSCGGMRFQQGWNGDIKPEEIEKRTKNASKPQFIARSNWALITSKPRAVMAFGNATRPNLPNLPREKLIVQTKVGPDEDHRSFSPISKNRWRI
jgi:predicted aldo/keto reductase-like oxidoreductase